MHEEMYSSISAISIILYSHEDFGDMLPIDTSTHQFI